jgi:hypothetical protein
MLGVEAQFLARTFHTHAGGALASCRLTQSERPKPARRQRSGLGDAKTVLCFHATLTQRGNLGETILRGLKPRGYRQIMMVGLEWGCPLVLSWAMYNTEYSHGVENGYWLIDNQGFKQAEWHTLADFYRETRSYVADCLHRTGPPPTEAEYHRYALSLVQ